MSMKLEEVLAEIRSELDADDKIREGVLPIARSAVRKCSQSIKESHRGNFQKAEALLTEAYNLIKEGSGMSDKSEFVLSSRQFSTAYQELAEAANVLSLLRDNSFTPPKTFNIPSRAYLTGLADTVGELRRAILDLLRSSNLTRAEELLGYMEEIFEELHSLDYPNALIPDLRRKTDVARSLIERTRGNITSAAGQEKLVKELRSFEGRLDGLKRD
jgi:translin